MLLVWYLVDAVYITAGENTCIHKVSGLKKVPSDCLGQVDFSLEQVTFHSHLPNGQGIRQSYTNLNIKRVN